jgi:hypothetical protein
MTMNSTRRQVAGILASTILILGWGCGDGTPPATSSTNEATVSGTVKVKGKPVTKGAIVFSAGNINRKVEPRKAAIGPDGSYTIKAYVGENSIMIEANDVLKYHLEAETITYQVQDGENKYDIDLGAPPKP